MGNYADLLKAHHQAKQPEPSPVAKPPVPDRPEPSISPVPQTPRRQDVQTQRQQDEKTSFRRDTKTSLRQDSNASRQQAPNVSRQKAVESYDINAEGFERETVRLSKAEQRAAEQLKLSVRDTLDSTIGKNDIFRVGLHFLLEDFHKHGERSEVVSRLRKKRK
jgi:hypothetical protein